MQRLVEYADELVTSVGPRLSASDAEHEAANIIAANFEDLGLETWIQDFACASNTRWGRILYCLLGVIAAELLFLMPGLAPLSLILALIAFALLALDLLGKSPLNKFFSKAQSQNVVARYAPEGADPRRKVVVIAHYDSARSWLQCAPPVVRFYPLARTVVRVCLAALVVVALFTLFPLPEIILTFLSVLGLLIGIVLLVAALVEAVNIFMPATKGANNNASGVAAVMGIAETITGARSGSGLDTGGRRLEEVSERPRTSRESRQSARSSARRSAGAEPDSFDHYDEDALYDDDMREKAAAKVSSLGLSGAAGALLSRAKGMMGRSAAHEDDDLLPPQMQGDEGQTADLGGAVSSAARAAEAAPASDDLQPRVVRRTVPEEENSAASFSERLTDDRPAPQLRVGTPLGSPTIKVRAPLTPEQEQQQRALEEEAQARANTESGRTKDGMPAWFVDAKKAAHKDTKKSTAEVDPKVSRSRYADVPVEYAQEGAAQTKTAAGAEQAAQQTGARASQQSQAKQQGQSQAKQQGQSQARQQDESQARQQAESQAGQQGESQASQQGKSESLDQTAGKADSQATDQAAGSVAGQVAAVGGHDQQGASQPRKDERDPQRVAEPATTLNADFSGIDRLASDPLPTPAPRVRLPESATSLEQAAAAPTPDIPENDKLRNLPSLSLGNSGAIKTQQAAFDQQSLFDDVEPLQGSGKVSNTGSFAPLGATGIMKPIGEELLEYHEGNEQDIYLDDADESGAGSYGSRGSSRDYAPQLAEMPKSRAKSFFGSLGERLSGGRGKREHLDSSPSEWLGVDEDFDARTEGSQIGGWDNFSEEDDEGWKGGAYGGGSYEEDVRALSQFSSTLIDKEIWFVAAGAHESDNAGIAALISGHERELRNALFINIDAVGAGDLCYTMAEGTFSPRGTDHRLQGLIRSAADALGVDLAPTGLRGYNSEAVTAMKMGGRAISIVGLDQQLPVGWHWKDDHLDILDEDNLEAVVDVTVEVIKSI